MSFVPLVVAFQLLVYVQFGVFSMLVCIYIKLVFVVHLCPCCLVQLWACFPLVRVSRYCEECRSPIGSAPISTKGRYAQSLLRKASAREGTLFCEELS